MRYTKEFKDSVLTDYKNGIESKIEDYLITKGISKTTFYKWIKEIDNDKPNLFIDITQSINNCSSNLLISINDININIDNNYDESLLLKLLRTIKKL